VALASRNAFFKVLYLFFLLFEDSIKVEREEK
jgi:hypothetical protein